MGKRRGMRRGRRAGCELADVDRKCAATRVARLVLVATLLSAYGPLLGWASPARASRLSSDSGVRHCTILTVSQGNRVFFGANDDYTNYDTTYWVDSGDATRNGAIFFGKPNNIQQGFNDKGLAYDANELPDAPVTSHPGQEPVSGGYTSYPIQILHECATVEEVIAWVQAHRWHTAMRDQLHFADATGDAVVISAGPDGKVAFTRKPPGDSFLVSTNFNVANPSNGGYPCWRHSRAEEMLSRIENQDELTAERVASVMDAVHVESASGWTLNTLVADLPKRLVYVYFMFQYDSPIVLNVDAEIARAPSLGPLSARFPPETVNRAERAHQRLMSRSDRGEAAAWAWLGVVCASLIALLLLSWRRRGAAPRILVLWIPAVAVLGPIGLLVWWIAGRGERRDTEAVPRIWPRALVEVVCDLPPYIIGLVAALLAVIFVPALSGPSPLQLLVIYGLPLGGGLLLIHTPLLAGATGSGYARLVIRRIPTALVSTNLSLAGLLAVTPPLMIWCGFASIAFLRLWAVAIPGALVGGLLLYVHHGWAIRRGFTTWSALLCEPSEAGDVTAAVSYPSWRRLWLWVLVSFVALIAGLALGAIGTQLVTRAG